MAKPLTVLAIENAKADPAKRVEIGDGGCAGLRLAIAPSGAKTWVYRYKFGGRAGKLTIGGASTFSLKEARAAADDARRQVARGIDPAREKVARRRADMEKAKAETAAAAGVVSKVVDQFVAEYASARKSGTQIARLLRKELAPWSQRHMTSITRDDATALLEDIAERGAPVTSNRVRANARKLWSWATALSSRKREKLGIADLGANPFVGAGLPAAEKARDRILTDDELRLVLAGAAKIGVPFGPMVRLLVLTAARRNECSGMEWSETALRGNEPIWTMPPARTKNGRAHSIPLAKTTAAIIDALPRIAGPDDTPARFVFTTTGTTPVSGFSRAKATLDKAMIEIARKASTEAGSDAAEVEAISPWGFHDLRRTVASGMARLGIALPVIERCLNHVSGSFGGIVGVYQRHDFAPEMRRAFDIWANHIAELEGSAGGRSNVVPLAKRG